MAVAYVAFAVSFTFESWVAAGCVLVATNVAVVWIAKSGKTRGDANPSARSPRRHLAVGAGLVGLGVVAVLVGTVVAATGTSDTWIGVVLLGVGALLSFAAGAMLRGRNP